MRLYISVNLKQYPLTFVLGFYVGSNMITIADQSQFANFLIFFTDSLLGLQVSLIIKRWWTQYELLPWPGWFVIVIFMLVFITAITVILIMVIIISCIVSRISISQSHNF